MRRVSIKLIYSQILLIAICLLCSEAEAQSTFQKFLKDSLGHKFYQTTIRYADDEKKMIMGMNEFQESFCMVLNKQDSILWTRKYSLCTLKSGAQTSDGGYILTGITTDFGPPPPVPWLSTVNTIVIKIDSMGNIEWSKAYGNPYADYGYCIKELPGKNYMIAGTAEDTLVLYNHHFAITKIDSSGNLLWQKFIGSVNEGPKTAIPIDNGFVMMGVVGTEIKLAKIDNEGNLIWMKGLTLPFDPASLFNLSQTMDKGYLITANHDYASFNLEGLIIRADSNGNPLWCKKYRMGESIYFRDVKQKPNGHLIVTGYTDYNLLNKKNEALLAELDEDGDPIWLHSYGENENDKGSALLVQDDSTIYMTGELKLAATTIDLYFIKFNHLGESGSVCFNTHTFSSVSSFSVSSSNIAAGYFYKGTEDTAIIPDTLLVPQAFYLCPRKTFHIEYDPGELNDNNHTLLTSDHSFLSTGGHSFSPSLYKMDFDGNFKWFKTYYQFNSSGSWTEGIKVVNVPERNYALAIDRKGLPEGSLYKTDSTGVLIWRQNFRFNDGEQLSMGDLEVTADHEFLLAGGGLYIERPTFMMKFDSSGNYLWAREYGLEYYPQFGYKFPVKMAIHDKQHLACTVSSLVFGTNDNGELNWSKTLNGYSYSEKLTMQDIVSTSYGYIVSGSYEKTYPLVRQRIVLFGFDTLGNLLWSNSYALDTSCIATNSSLALKIVKFSDFLFCVSGKAIVCPFGEHEEKFFTFGIDEYGNFQWAKFHNPSLQNIRSVNYAGFNQLIMSGIGGDDAFLHVKAVMDSSIACGESYAEFIVEPYQVIVLDTIIPDDLIQPEFFQDSVIVDTLPGPRTLECFTTGPVDSAGSVIVSGPEVTSNLNESSIQLYPNPTNGPVTIVLPSTSDMIQELNVYDIYGRWIKRIDLSNQISNVIDLGELSSGIYILTLSNRSTYYTQKIILAK